MAVVHIDAQTGLVVVSAGVEVRVLDQADLRRAAMVMLACVAAGVAVTPELVWSSFGCPPLRPSP